MQSVSLFRLFTAPFLTRNKMFWIIWNLWTQIYVSDHKYQPLPSYLSNLCKMWLSTLFLSCLPSVLKNKNNFPPLTISASPLFQTPPPTASLSSSIYYWNAEKDWKCIWGQKCRLLRWCLVLFTVYFCNYCCHGLSYYVAKLIIALKWHFICGHFYFPWKFWQCWCGAVHFHVASVHYRIL